MAKFLQNVTSMNNLPIVTQMLNKSLNYNAIFLKHLTIPVYNLGTNSKLGSTLNSVEEQKFIQSHICRSFHTTSFNNKNFYTITFQLSTGEKQTVKGKEGDSLLDVANNNQIDIPGYGACEGTLSCSTCHLMFNKEDYNKIDSPLTDEELDILDTAKDFSDTSRLGCQVCMSKAIDGMTVQVPEYLIDVRVATSS